jgi:hypothetical protein
MPDNFDLYGLMEDELELEPIFDDPQRAAIALEEPEAFDPWLLEDDFDDL